MSITVNISCGIGSWEAVTQRIFVTCPHVGDDLVVGEDIVHCDVVLIGEQSVWVKEKRKFTSPEQVTEVEKAWMRD